MLLSLFLLLLGLALIVKGGDWFVSASLRIAELLHLPRVVIGSTLVSLATTSPEMVVSVMAGLHGESGLAAGNAVGSCVCNIALVLGGMAILKHVQVHRRSLAVSMVAMVGSGLLVFLLTLDLVLSRRQGMLLVGIGVAYFVYDFFRHERRPRPVEVLEASEIEREHLGQWRWLRGGWGVTVVFLLGAGLVILGSRLLVGAAVDIAERLGVPSMVIGMTVVAVGTSLPEIVTALTSSLKNVSDLAVGNILGANIVNLTLVIGGAASLSPMELSRASQLFSFPALLLLMVLVCLGLLSERQLSRREGIGLILYYVGYLAVVVILSLTGTV